MQVRVPRALDRPRHQIHARTAHLSRRQSRPLNEHIRQSGDTHFARSFLYCEGRIVFYETATFLRSRVQRCVRCGRYCHPRRRSRLRIQHRQRTGSQLKVGATPARRDDVKRGVLNAEQAPLCFMLWPENSAAGAAEFGLLFCICSGEKMAKRTLQTCVLPRLPDSCRPVESQFT